MAFQKTKRGDRCLLQVDGAKVIAELQHGKVGIGNPRFGSAVQILKDSALLKKNEGEVTRPTEEGLALLESELQNGGDN